MKQKKLRTMMALVSTIIIGGSLLAGCGTKKDNNIADVNAQGAIQEPTQDATVEPTQEAEPTATTEPTAEPTQEPVATAEPEHALITVDFPEYEEKFMDDEDTELTLVNLKGTKPFVYIQHNEEASQKINDYFDSLISNLKKEAEDCKADAKEVHSYWNEENMGKWYGYEMDITFNLERYDDYCISFSSSGYYDYLGAHPSSEILGYTFNTKTGELLKLEDFVEDMPAFKEQVNNRILAFCDEINEEYGNSDDEDYSMFNMGFKDEIPNVLQEDTWYFDKQGFEVIANEYTIAPHAFGVFNVLIPYKELEFVKDEVAVK